MEAGKSFQRLAWLAAIALIVACGIGVAVIMGWIPSSLVKPEAFAKRVGCASSCAAIQPNA